MPHYLITAKAYVDVKIQADNEEDAEDRAIEEVARRVDGDHLESIHVEIENIKRTND